MRKLSLVMIDECGDETVIYTHELSGLELELDEIALDCWKEMKIRQFRNEYEEANGFYWEDYNPTFTAEWYEERERHYRQFWEDEGYDEDEIEEMLEHLDD